MKVGVQILWNVIPICGTCKITCLMGRHLTRGDSENPSQKGLILTREYGKTTIERLKSKWNSVEFWSVAKRCREGHLVRRDSLQQERTRISWIFEKVQRVRGDSWRSWRKTQNPLTVTTRCGRTTCAHLLPTFHILRIFLEHATEIWSQTRRRHGRSRCKHIDIENIYDRHSSSRSSSWKRLCGKFTFHPKSAWANIETVKRIKKEIQGISVINWKRQTWHRTTFLLIRQFSYQMRKPTCSPTQYCVWEGSVEIPSKFGRRRSIGFRIHFKIESWIESMASRWSSSGKISQDYHIADHRRDSKHADWNKARIRAIPRTDRLRDTVQRHRMERTRKQRIVDCEFLQFNRICEKFRRTDIGRFSGHNYFRQSAQYLRSSSGHVWRASLGNLQMFERVQGETRSTERFGDHGNANRIVVHKSNLFDRWERTGRYCCTIMNENSKIFQFIFKWPNSAPMQVSRRLLKKDSISRHLMTLNLTDWKVHVESTHYFEVINHPKWKDGSVETQRSVQFCM